MAPTEPSPSGSHDQGGRFLTTHWSVVVRAGASPCAEAHQALATLCQTYWYPLYAFVRRQGHSPHDAQDLTQEFFVRLLQSHFFAAADPRRGRFRSFLLASLKHFLMHEWQKAHAQRRGGGAIPVPLNADTGETRYGLEPVENTTAEKLYERRWALTVLDAAIARLQGEYADKREMFEVLKPALTGDRGLPPYAEVAVRLGMTEGAVKVAVHRLRQRYGELLRDEVAQTVASPEDIEAELRCLITALS